MFFVLIITLYISRVVLNVLGVEDFGIYNVVAGFVSLFAFIESTLSASMQRFYNIEIGGNNEEGIGKVYRNGIYTHVVISLLAFILLESFGLWYVNNIMNIPNDRLFAANILFQLSIISLVLTLLKIPYVSVILAYEKMDYYSIITILDVIMKLGSVFLLPYIKYDNLISYSFLLLVVSILNFFCYYLYSKIQFKALSFNSFYDSRLMKSMLSFSGWNLVGTFAFMLKGQGLNLVLNYFFGPIVNAARGIAFQVHGGVSGFSGNIATAFRPQLVNAYAGDDHVRTIKLMYVESKVSFILIGMVLIPIIFNIDYVLSFWLGDNVPAYTGIFTVLTLIDLLVCSLNTPCTQVVFATGKLKKYQSASSLVNIMLIPCAYYLLYLGCSSVFIFKITILFSILNQMVCVYYTNQVLYFGIKSYVVDICIPCLSFITLLYILSYFVSYAFPQGWLCLLLLCFISAVFSIIMGFILVLNRNEKKYIVEFLNHRLCRK